MRTMIGCITVFFLTVLIFGCGSKPMADVREVETPEWMFVPPDEEGYRFGAQMAESKGLRMAIRSATRFARAEIAAEIADFIEDTFNEIEGELGWGEDAEIQAIRDDVVRAISDEAITGSRVRERRFGRYGELYRAYVLVEYPLGEASERFMEQLRMREEFWNAIRKTRAYETHDKRIQEHRERQRQR